MSNVRPPNMRRTTLKFLAACSLALPALPSLAVKARKVDKRLLGTWRSDKERTTQFWRYKSNLDAEQKAKFESIFGKLRRRFTETHSYSEFDGEKTSGRYLVVASDSKSVVLAFPEEHFDLQQIFFEENAFYVASGYNFEFFRREA
jgi:hypothetical protein